MVTAQNLKIKIFGDGADLVGIRVLTKDPLISGFTTNPTLMNQAGVADYLSFAREVVTIVGDKPLSLEVFSDEFDEMKRQARTLFGLSSSVYVKIPITNCRGESSSETVRTLSGEGVKINVTAVFTMKQVETTLMALRGGASSFISIFAGRIADAGIDPIPMMQQALQMMSNDPQVELIWASPRELLNIVQANDIGCHVITVTHELLKKLPILGRNLEEFSLDTIKMFANDALAAGYTL